MIRSTVGLAREERRGGVTGRGHRAPGAARSERRHMSLLDKLKALFGGKKTEDTSLYDALEKQISALENRLSITEHMQRVDGGVEAFDLALDETRRMLDGFSAEGAGQDELDLLRQRMDLARQVAHLLHETDPEKKKQMCQAFVDQFRPVRDQLHYRTKTKYERIRIDFQSGRIR